MNELVPIASLHAHFLICAESPWEAVLDFPFSRHGEARKSKV